VEGRRIEYPHHRNGEPLPVLLAQELMRNYHRDKGSPRCALKVYLLKAYDTINWEFLVATLQATGFPQRVIHWIKECITTARFSVNINGELCGFFSNSRGLRQGDPMSPYLFAFAMQVFSGLMEATNKNFQFHWKFQKERISHLCFADDLLILCRGEEGGQCMGSNTT